MSIASRLASEADRHQTLVTADVWKETRDLPGIEFVRVGKRRLKGLTGQTELFEVRSSSAPGTDRTVDPVCGMELTVAEVAARLTLDAGEQAFCSDDCLRKFVAAPEAYAT